jgi:hypothetical protein
VKSVLFAGSQRCFFRPMRYVQQRSLESVLTHIESRPNLYMPHSHPLSCKEGRPILLFLIPSSQRISSTISPRIGKVRGVSHAAPVCAEIILGRRKVPAAGKGSRHAYALQLATNRSVL